jgi:outer membrane protein
MKSLILRALLLSTLLLALAVPAQAQQKIGYVDLKKLFDGYWKTKQADANLKDQAGGFDKQKKVMLDDYQKAQDEYKKLLDSANDQAVSTEEREKRKKTAEAKVLELREIEQSIGVFDRTARTTLAEKQKTERDKILDEIKAIVNSMARKGGYTLVLNVAAEDLNNTSVILYTDGKDDLTEEILKQLNATAPLALPSPADGKKK